MTLKIRSKICIFLYRHLIYRHLISRFTTYCFCDNIRHISTRHLNLTGI